MTWQRLLIELGLPILAGVIIQIVRIVVKSRDQRRAYEHAYSHGHRLTPRPNNLTCPLCGRSINAGEDDQRELPCGHRCHSTCYLARQNSRCSFCCSNQEVNDREIERCRLLPIEPSGAGCENSEKFPIQAGNMHPKQQ